MKLVKLFAESVRDPDVWLRDTHDIVGGIRDPHGRSAARREEGQSLVV
jgi:hypothetical protein